MPDIIGREAELRMADLALGRVANGLSVLLIRGDAGIGKSTIWAEVVGRAEARGWRVLQARAAAAEAPLTLTTLADLLEPLGPELAVGLPVPQQAAIAAALLEVQPPARSLEPRVLGAAVRSALSRLATETPLLIAIDDVQWVDAATSAVLGFALRRLTASRIAVVLALRSGETLPFEASSAGDQESRTTIDVGPLSLAAIHELLKARTGAAPSRSKLVRIHEASGGSPLFALEIARLLEEMPAIAPGEPLPVPTDVEALVRGRVGALGPSTREALLLVAALGRGKVEIVEAALGRRIDVDLGVADQAGITHERAGEVTFRHPLYAAAVLSAARPGERRSAHRRLAAVLDQAEERARHRALGAEGPSEAIAAELESAAHDADRRGAPAAAAELLDLSVRLTPAAETDAAAERSLALAAAIQRGGELGRAAAILEQVIDRGAAASLRARARLALAAIRYETDATSTALELSEAAIADAADDPELRIRALASAAAVDWTDYRRRSARIDEAYRLLESLPEADPAVAGLVLMERVGQDSDAGRPLDPELVARALAAERLAPARNVSERFSAALGAWLKYRDEFDAARDWMERAHQAAIDEGDEGSLPYALSHLPELELWTGRWARAREIAEAHLALAGELGLEAQRRQATYNRALVDVHEGRVEAARSEIDAMLAAATADNDLWTVSSLEPLLGFLDLSLGHVASAAGHLRVAARVRDEMGQTTPRRFDHDLVEALLGMADLDGARTTVDAMSARARTFGVHSAAANAARSRALLAATEGEIDAALADIDDALEEHALGPIPFDRARTLLALGRIRRRRRERHASADALEEAASAFEALGARIWAETARAELERVKLRRATGDQLTEGERRVAELVAHGMTNREVAAALFMSPKTVEANLARAYSKLEIRNRAQLGAALARSTPSPGRKT